MPDWSAGEDRYMSEWREEDRFYGTPARYREYVSLTDASCRPRCRVCGDPLEPDSGACATCSVEDTPPCPNCDGPVVEGEGVLCADCRAAEILAFTRPRP